MRARSRSRPEDTDRELPSSFRANSRLTTDSGANSNLPRTELYSRRVVLRRRPWRKAHGGSRDKRWRSGQGFPPKRPPRADAIAPNGKFYRGYDWNGTQRLLICGLVTSVAGIPGYSKALGPISPN